MVNRGAVPDVVSSTVDIRPGIYDLSTARHVRHDDGLRRFSKNTSADHFTVSASASRIDRDPPPPFGLMQMLLVREHEGCSYHTTRGGCCQHSLRGNRQALKTSPVRVFSFHGSSH